MSSCVVSPVDQGPPPGGAEFDAALALVPAALTEGEQAEALVVIDRLRRRLDAVAAEVTGVFDTRCTWAADGAKSAAGWLAARTDRSHGVCNTEVRLARVLRDMPVVEEAAREGRLGREKVRALAWARQEGLEEAFAACEEDLVRDVASFTVAGAWRYLRRWVDLAKTRLGVNDPDGPEPKDGVGGSKVTLGQAMEGRWFGTLDLEADDGEVLANAIANVVENWWRTGVFHTDDGLTTAERKARALVEVVTRGAGGGDRDGTAKPLILALVDAATLLGFPTGGSPEGPGLGSPDALLGAGPTDGSGPGAREELGVLDGLTAEQVALVRLCELSRSGPVSLATMQRLACEGAIAPVIVGTDGDPLRMGREIRLFNREQRRALRIRDGHCVFAGCSVPAEACIAHHLHYWENGGPTDIDNGALLCPFHHRLVHDAGYTLRRDDHNGRFVTTRPDGFAVGGTRASPPVVQRRRPPPGPRPGDEPDPDVILCTRTTRRRIDALIREAEANRADRARDPVPV